MNQVHSHDDSKKDDQRRDQVRRADDAKQVEKRSAEELQRLAANALDDRRRDERTQDALKSEQQRAQDAAERDARQRRAREEETQRLDGQARPSMAPEQKKEQPKPLDPQQDHKLIGERWQLEEEERQRQHEAKSKAQPVRAVREKYDQAASQAQAKVTNVEKGSICAAAKPQPIQVSQPDQAKAQRVSIVATHKPPAQTPTHEPRR